MAKRRTAEQLHRYIHAVLIPPERFEYVMIESVEQPLFYALTDRRLIGTHVFESGTVGVTSIPYSQISAVSIIDGGPKEGILDSLVASELELFGAFGRLRITRTDHDEALEMYRRLLGKLMGRVAASPADQRSGETSNRRASTGR